MENPPDNETMGFLLIIGLAVLVVAIFLASLGMRGVGLLMGSDIDFRPSKHPILFVFLFPFWVVAGAVSLLFIGSILGNR